MHSILQHQLSHYFSDTSSLPTNPQAWTDFLNAISQTYDHFDEDRRLVERSLQLSSQELNQQNQELQAQGARNQAILSSISEGLISTDSSGTIQLVNKVAERMLGLSVDELSQQNLFNIFTRYGQAEIVTPPDKPSLMDRILSGNQVSENFEFTKPNGDTLVIHIDAGPIVQAEKTVGFLAVIRDVTIERQLDRLKTEFISIASHQLRTPLSAVKWFAEMLLEGDGGELNLDQKEFVQNIYDSTERMIMLVNSLLNISRVESGRIVVSPQPLNIRTLIEEILNYLHPKIQASEINVIVSIPDDLPTINLDQTLIKEVYLNLISNAVRYNKKNGSITISVSSKDGDIISQISDTGFGIPHQQQERLFEKFFRADNIAKFDTEGIGLGLYLTKIIINLANGKIWFESEENKGTTFWFSVPLSGMASKSGEVALDSALMAVH